MLEAFTTIPTIIYSLQSLICSLQVVLRLGRDKTPSLDLHLVQGIESLRNVPLDGRTVEIQFIHNTITVEGVNWLLDFCRGKFTMPEKF